MHWKYPHSRVWVSECGECRGRKYADVDIDMLLFQNGPNKERCREKWAGI